MFHDSSQMFSLSSSSGTRSSKPEHYPSLSLPYITFVLTMLVSFAICVPPPPPLDPLTATLNTSLGIEFELRQIEWLTALSAASIASQPLLDDIDLDGDLDLVFATVDGAVYGYRSIRKRLDHRNTDDYLSNWSFVVHGEKFVSSPVLVPFDEKGHSLIVIVSVRGVIYALDSEGALVVQIQIPDLTFGTSAERRSFTSNLRDVVNSLQWHSAAWLNDSESYRLQPRVYATALVPRVAYGHHQALTDSMNSDALVIPVNFISGADVLLAALLGVPRRLFLSTHLWGSAVHAPDDPGRGFSIHLLEMGKLQDTSPPYLFASPSLVASPMPDALLRTTFYVENRSTVPTISWRPTYRAVVPSFSGRLHLVSLPLGKLGEPNSIRHETWFSGTQSSSSLSFADSCVLVNCGLANPMSNSTICCLLVDYTSRLLLLSLGSHGKSAPHHHSLLWIYTPRLLQSVRPHMEQLGQVTVVRCHSAVGYDDRWAVYPTPDGYLHAVNLTTGSSVSGFPLQLIPAEVSANVTFAVGPGLLYSSADYTQWLLLTDTTGVMYHVTMCRTPVVVRSVTPLSKSAHVPTIPLSPISFVTIDRKEGVDGISEPIQKLTVLMLSEKGVIALVPNTTLRRPLHTGPYGRAGSNVQPWVMMPVPGSIYFVDSAGDPIVRVLMERDERLVHYRITDCPTIDPHRFNPSDDTRIMHAAIAAYITQLIDSFGMPLSEWSIANVQPNPPSCPVRGPCAAVTTAICAGPLSVSRPVYGSFRGRLQLLVIDLRTGLLISPPTSGSTFIGSILVDIETLWPQLITLWTYLPLIYLFTGLTILHISQTHGSLRSPKRAKCVHSA